MFYCCWHVNGQFVNNWVYLIFFQTGDPLYGIGGCPKPFEPDPIDDDFAEDG